MAERAPGRSPRCPGGVEDDRVAGLVDDPGDEALLQHVRECSICAERYMEHLVISRELCRVSRAARSVDGSAGRGAVPEEERPGSADSGSREERQDANELTPSRTRRGTLRGILVRPIPVAAVLLVGIAGLAVGGVALWVRGVLVAPGAGLHGRVSDWERVSNLDLRGAGFPSESVVDAWTSFAIDSSRVGTAVAGPITQSRRVAVAGFDETGRLGWSTATMDGAEAWPELGDVEYVNVQGIGTVVSRRSAAAAEVTLWVVMDRAGAGAIYLADPLTGALRGRFVHSGPLGRRSGSGASVYALPAADGDPRRLLVSGHHVDRPVPVVCVSVIDADGSLVQHLEFPSLGSASIDGPDVINVQIDWAAGHENVTVQTSEDVIFALPVVDRRLDPSRTRVEFGSTARARFDAAKGAGRFAELLKERRGEAAVLQELAGGVRVLEPQPKRDWRRE